jgi:hypothetical protein
MKRLLILLLFIISLFPSCNEDEFLAETPKDDIFADNLYVSYDGFQNGLYGLYALARLEITDASEPQYLWKLGVDNAFCGFAKGAEAPFNDYNVMYSSVSTLETTFEWLYLLVNAANTIITRAEGDDIDWQGSDDAEDLLNKNSVVAHARLLRANAYRHLTGCWGAVPLSTEEINGTNYRNDWERTPVADIQDVMEEDWIFARDNLDMVEETGFANSAVAGHYLAELYLTQERFDEAETEAKRVINSSEYNLMTERFGTSYDYLPNPVSDGVVYMDLFANPSREDGNNEVLWTINNAATTIVGSVQGSSKNTWITYGSKSSELKSLDAKTIYWYNGGRGRGRGTVSDSALAWYEPTDDRYSEYAFKKYYIYPTDDTETEFYIAAYTTTNYSGSKLEVAYLWPWPRKYEYLDLENRDNSEDPFSYRSEMFLRLANTYLILAETLYKNNNSAEAAIYINEIRSRSNASLITESDVDIEFILKERSRELATEEDRRYALNRNNLFLEWTSKYNPILESGVTVYEYNNLFPIPQSIIDSNTGSVLEQNPGYN